jgi:hypothetical protein
MIAIARLKARLDSASQHMQALQKQNPVDRHAVNALKQELTNLEQDLHDALSDKKVPGDAKTKTVKLS